MIAASIPARPADRWKWTGRLFAISTATAAGLALYLWPALAAPVVVWSDSVLDMEWARTGAGIVRPIETEPDMYLDHPAKPIYLLYLRAAMAAIPKVDEARSAVIVQSVLLWISIAATSLYLGRCRGWGIGLALYLSLVLLLRIRDASSAVMSEAISAALALPLVVLLLSPPRRRRGSLALWGISAALLFWIRPNVGLLVVGIATIVLVKQWDRLALLLLSFAAVTASVWLLTRSAAGSDPGRGIATPVLGASVDYYWSPLPASLPKASPGEISREKLRQAARNWRRALSHWDADTRRQILWRALHGLFASEFYDARWSRLYRRLDTMARVVAPVATLSCVALVLAFPFRRDDNLWNAAALFLMLALVAQNLLLGSHPRYVLPFLPILVLLALAGFDSLRAASRPQWLIAAAVFAAGVLLFSARPGLLDWEWGRVESEGVRLVQRIPKRALPQRLPATLHLRIAPPVLPTNAQLEIFGPGSRLLYTSSQETRREKPFVAIPIPDWLLEANGRGSVELELVSRGGYDNLHYLLFPIVPRPWGAPAYRVGGNELSPSTGIASGSLDWWAHAGFP